MVFQQAPHPFLCIFYFLLLPCYVSDSSCIFCASALASATSPVSPGSFYWGKVLRNQDLDTRCAHHYWDVTASRPSQWAGRGDIGMYTNTHRCACLCFCVHRSTFVLKNHGIMWILRVLVGPNWTAQYRIDFSLLPFPV